MSRMRGAVLLLLLVAAAPGRGSAQAAPPAGQAPRSSGSPALSTSSGSDAAAAAAASDADAAPTVPGRPSRRALPGDGDEQGNITAAECPGLESGGRLCGKACQLRMCQALADIYRASNNVSDPWDNEKGWELTATTPCSKLVGGASPRQAVYCTWFGITCCTPPAMADGECNVLNGITALELSINNLNVSLGNPLLLPSLRKLHDCGMTVLNLEANNLIGPFTDAWGEMHRLTVFNFGNCWVSGSIPKGLSRLRRLNFINLSNNWLNGTLPAWIANLPELRVINLGSNNGGNDGSNLTGLLGSLPQLRGLTKLRELNVEANSLTGELPKELCSAGDKSKLILLNVRNNKLSGPATPVESCGNLVQLDISQNAFTGALPASTDWDELATYRAGSNKFKGRLPLNLTTARILEHLDVSDNQLTGFIPPQITLLSSLKTFVVAGNKLRGTINENIFFLPALSKLDMSSNKLVGTIPVAVGLAYGLVEVDLSNNPGITGVLPPQMGLLSRLKAVRTSNTSLSCAGVTRPYVITTNNSCSNPDRCLTPVEFGNNDTRLQRCPQDELLPCFLRFSDYLVPRDDYSNMRCRYIVRRNLDAARSTCASGAATALGDQASSLPDFVSERVEQLWHMDASYYQYQICDCLMGYQEVWTENNTMLTCVLKPAQAPTSIIVGVIAAAAVVAFALLAWWQYLATRPRWLRERILQAKRSRGAPKATKPGDKVAVSIVVTDVKDFSDLTRQYPDLMNKAMGIHNNILRKACHTHAGCILDQEGDSWTVAFHEPEDAVAFSLQVQQALAHRSWGKPGKSFAYPSDEIHDLDGMRGGPLSGRFSSTQLSSYVTHGSRDDSSCYGILGQEGYSSTPPRGGSGLEGAANASFTGLARPVSSPGMASSFSSGSGAGRTGSFSQQQQQPAAGAANASEYATPSHSMVLPEVPAGRGARGDAAAAATLSAAARALAPYSKTANGSGGSSQHQPDQRQVSFTDAVLNRDVNGGAGHNRGEQRQLQPLGRTSSELDHTVGSSGPSGRSWQAPDELPALGPNMQAGRKSSFGGSTFSMTHGDPSMTGKRSSGSGSRLWMAVRRISVFGRSGMSGHLAGPGEPSGLHSLHLSVRIGIASGHLTYGNDLSHCSVNDRAKNFVSEAANGGQVLMDEATFKAIKDSLSVLGTVNENGYDDRQLQQLLHTRVVHRLQHHMCCGMCSCTACKSHAQREMSFSSHLGERDPQDYDNDALVVHMGAFEAPALPHPLRSRSRKQHRRPAAADAAKKPADGEHTAPASPSGTADDTAEDDTAGDTGGDTGGDDTAPEAAAAAGDGRNTAAAPPAAGAGAAAAQPAGSKEAAAGAAAAPDDARKQQRRQLHLYAVAAPGMRRQPATTQDLSECLSWSLPVRMLPGWVQTQKGYFDAPAARQMDLAPAANAEQHCQASLPDVTIVFVQVVGASGFAFKRQRREAHAVSKAIRRCMLQMLDEVQEGHDGTRDGYLCRCQEADMKYMIAFASPHKAVQWCLLVQEAMMYFNWPGHVLAHPGFEEVLDPITRLPVFRGPRLRMGLAEGKPNSVLPDHTGRANYYGHAVNRAARFMDAAAHGGQVVTDVDTVAKVWRLWRGEDVWGGGCDSRAPSRAHSDADVAPLVPFEQPDSGAMAVAPRSLSETTGHCRPWSTARQPSRLSVRQQQQQAWLQQVAQPQQQHGQLRASGASASSSGLLPDMQRLTPQPQHLAVAASGGSFTRQHLAVAASGGSFTRQMQQLAVAQSELSLTRQQIAGNNRAGSFTRQQQQQASASPFHREQHGLVVAASSNSQAALSRLPAAANMTGSFSARRLAAAGGSAQYGGAAGGMVQPSAGSFVMQVPAGWRDVLSGAVAENVSATLLGTFTFKGSGVFSMANILHAALAGRTFPSEAPKGKGARVLEGEGPVPGLEPVGLVIPPQLLAARQAFANGAAQKG